MSAEPTVVPVPPGGPVSLSQLARAQLSPATNDVLRQVGERAGGTPAWRNRKRREMQDLFALVELAPAGRLSIEMLDPSEVLRVMVRLRVPVPCMLKPPAGELAIAPFALLGISYPEAATRQPLPGFAFVQILQPSHVWHANVSPAFNNLCLGAQLPAGIRLTEVVLLAYAALSMQAVMFDPHDAAGVLNREAAHFWQHNTHRLPLSKTPFLGKDNTVAEAQP